jgi:class 3 adenylate cyclase/cell fate (sporulation/competence/biofilm development) regulator YmcA (YheA/YmcA/DUF963 family)
MKIRDSFFYKGLVSLLFLAIAVSGYSQQDSIANRHQELLTRLGSTTNDSLQSFLNTELGRTSFIQKEYHAAIGYFKQALSYLEKRRDQEAVARIHLNIARCHAAQRAREDAIASLEKARVYASKDGVILPRIYEEMISVENDAGNIPKVLEYAQQLLSLARTRSDYRLEGRAYNFMGYGYHVYGNIEQAGKSYANALKNYVLAGDTAMITSLQINMGEYYLGMNNPDSASWYLNQALKTYTAANNKTRMALIYERLGGIYLMQKDFEGLFNLSKKSISLAREIDDKKLLSFYGFQSEAYKLAKLLGTTDSFNIAQASTEQKKELDEIIRNMTTNLKLYQQQAVSYQEISKMYQNLTNAQVLNRDFEGALESYALYSTYKDSFASAENVKQFATVDARYAFERSRDSLQLAEEQKRLLLQKEIALNTLKFEYEKKRALAKTEEERKRLLLEEQFKREAIEKDYIRTRDLNEARYSQSIALAKAEKDKQAILSQAEIRQLNYVRNISLAGASILLLFASGAIWAYVQKRKDNRKIALEKERSDELLLNILPAEVAEELKAEGRSEARRYNETTVLFTDFVNFTAISEQSEPEELLHELNICFTAFDKILEQYGLEKIKTIGDAYLAVSGLPKPDTRHATQAVRAALDILTFIAQRKKEHASGFDIRIGINSGPLIAGIVGVKKFAYDIWGDTVNTASRMESSGLPGKINISQATFELIHNEFTCIHRGKINAKNKGDIDMYFVDKIIN